MIFLTLLFGIATIAGSSPIELPSYPPTITSKGFRLIINVTDTTRDFSPSINGREIMSFHQQSIFGRATVLAGRGEIFYQYPHVDPGNRFAEFDSMILTELGPNTAGLQIANLSSIKSDMNINFGGGTMGAMLSKGGYYSYVRPFEYSGVPESFIVCNETIPWVSRNEDERFLTLDYLRYTDGKLVVPGGCAPVNLIAQCDTLPDVPKDSEAYPRHQLAESVRCYENVGAVDWTKYELRP
jgi:hypothetical protein